MNRTLKIQEEIKKVDSLIHTARKMLGEGLMADFTSIREKVATICKQAKKLEKEKNKKIIKPSLEELIFKMDRLSEELTCSFNNGFPENATQEGE